MRIFVQPENIGPLFDTTFVSKIDYMHKTYKNIVGIIHFSPGFRCIQTFDILDTELYSIKFIMKNLQSKLKSHRISLIILSKFMILC